MKSLNKENLLGLLSYRSYNDCEFKFKLVHELKEKTFNFAKFERNYRTFKIDFLKQSNNPANIQTCFVSIGSATKYPQKIYFLINV